MKHKTILITAGAAILAGTVIAAVGAGFGGLYEGEISHHSQTITETISAMNLFVDFGDITVIATDGNDINIRCISAEHKPYKINVENGVLSIDNKKESGARRKWHDYISFDFRKKQELIIEVPHRFEADVRIENNYGSVKVSDIKGSLSAKLDCGDIAISGCALQTLACENDYGDIKINRTVSEDIRLDNNCGDIEGIIRGKKIDYGPNGTRKLEMQTKLGDAAIRFTEE